MTQWSSRRRAAREGRRAGRAGLSVEEAADTPYLVRLRRLLHAEESRIDEFLADRTAALESAARDAEEIAQVLRAGRDELVTRARSASHAQHDRYQALCATYGEAWRRTHRDRGIARIGWRCPAAGRGPEEQR